MGAACVLLAALLWSAIAPLSRLALAGGLAPLQVAFGRALVAGIAFAVHVAVRGGARPRRGDAPAVAAFAGLGIALLFALNQLAVRQGGAALATVLLYSAPIWVSLVGPLAGEPRRRGATLAAVVAAAGIALLASGGGTIHATPLALLAGLGSGAAYAFYSLAARRLLRTSSPSGLFAVAMPLAAAILLAFGGAPAAPTATQALLLVAIGLLSFGGSLSFGLGLARLPAARASLLATIEPVSAAILAGVCFGERFGPAGLAGAALVLAAVVSSASSPSRSVRLAITSAPAPYPRSSPRRPASSAKLLPPPSPTRTRSAQISGLSSEAPPRRIRRCPGDPA